MQSVLSRYLDRVNKDNRTIDARGVMQVNRMIELTMDEVFIDLSVRMGRNVNKPIDSGYIWSGKSGESANLTGTIFDDVLTHANKSLHAEQLLWAGLPPFPAQSVETGVSSSTLWSRHNAWVLLGDPGAGKTTLLKHFALQNAQDYKNGNASIPILIPLRLFAAEWEQQPFWTAQDALFNYLADKGLSEIGFEQESERKELLEIFRQAISDGRALFLFDGLDEQRNADMQRKTVTAIEYLLEQYYGNRFLVSSRIIGYDAAPLGSSFYTATLEPFSDEQMEAFFRRWILAVEKHEDIEVDESTERRAKEKADQLIEQVKNNNGIRTLATNPLLCTIIGLIRRQGATLPQIRAELYKLCIDTFIFNWELQKRRRDDQKGSLNKDQTQAVLEELALHFHENCPENRTSQQAITDIIRDFLVKQEGITPESATHKASQLLSLIRDVSGLLIDRGNNEYGFFHLTFQEYLTARAITRRRRDIDRYLGQHLFEPRWREVIRMAAAHQGMKDEETGSEFIDAILCCKHPREAQMHYSFRLAFLCLKEARVELETSDRMFRNWIRIYLEQSELQTLLLKLVAQPGAKINYRADALQPLLSGLTDESKMVRCGAAQALGQIKDPSTVPALLVALNDKNDRIRWLTAEALGHIKDTATVSALLVALKDKNNMVRWGATQALRQFKDPSIVTALLVALKDKNDEIRCVATQVLGQIKHPSRIPALLVALKDTDATVRWRTAEVLGQIKDTSTVPALLDALKDKDDMVRLFAAQALRQFKEPSTVPALLVALKDKDDRIRWSATEALGQIKDPSALPALLDALKNGDDIVRRGAAEALGQVKDPTALPALLDALKNEIVMVRRGAAKALGPFKDTSTVPALLVALKDKDDMIRWRSAEALGQIKDPSTVTALLVALKDTDATVRLHSAQALGKIKDSSTVPALLVALKDTDATVRLHTAQALGKIKDPSTVPALLDALKDENNMVRRSAVQALGQIKYPSIEPALLAALKDIDNEVRRGAVHVLGQLKDPSTVPALLAALNDMDYEVRRGAVHVLGQIKDPSIVPALLAAIKDENIMVREGAANAIELIDLGTELCPD